MRLVQVLAVAHGGDSRKTAGTYPNPFAQRLHSLPENEQPLQGTIRARNSQLRGQRVLTGRIFHLPIHPTDRARATPGRRKTDRGAWHQRQLLGPLQRSICRVSKVPTQDSQRLSGVLARAVRKKPGHAKDHQLWDPADVCQRQI